MLGLASAVLSLYAVILLFVKKDVLMPGFILVSIFALVFGAAALNPVVSGLVSPIAISLLLLGVGSFALGSSLVTLPLATAVVERNLVAPRQRFFEFFLVLVSWAAFLTIVAKGWLLFQDGPFDSGWRNIRWNVTSSNGVGYGLVGYLVPFLNVVALREVVRATHVFPGDSVNKLRFFLLFMPGFVATFSSMGRAHVVGFLLAVAVIKVVGDGGKSLKPFAWLGLIGVVVFGVVGLALHKMGSTSSWSILGSAFESIYYRVISPLAAWSEVVSGQSQLTGGSYTLRFFVSLLQPFGFFQTVDPETIRPFFREKGVVTNLYTFLFPYYQDFGVFGLLVFPMVLGMTLSFVFIKGKRGRNPAWLLLMGLAFMPLLLSFGGERFFINASLWLQLIFWSFILTWRWRFDF